MSYSSELTRKRILKCAEKEFLEQGFAKANLRKIAKDAKATTGALYNYFNNKEVLFDALVKQPADTLLDAFIKMHQQMKQPAKDISKQSMEKQSGSNTDLVLDYIYENFTAFKLIFCRAEGTDYAAYIDKLAKIEEDAFRRMLSNPPGGNKTVDDFFLHVTVTSGFRDLYEVVSHDLSKEDALQFMEQIKRFRFAGWREILGY